MKLFTLRLIQFAFCALLVTILFRKYYTPIRIRIIFIFVIGITAPRSKKVLYHPFRHSINN